MIISCQEKNSYPTKKIWFIRKKRPFSEYSVVNKPLKATGHRVQGVQGSRGQRMKRTHVFGKYIGMHYMLTRGTPEETREEVKKRDSGVRSGCMKFLLDMTVFHGILQ
jgi:hypothetical protein